MYHNNYYNYILLDPRKPLKWEYQNIKFELSPFYVGKGKNKRYLDHYKYFPGDNPHKENIIKLLNKGGYIPTYKIINNNISEDDALIKETEIIKWIKENIGDVLTNIQDGGNQPPQHFGKDNPKARKVYQYDKDSGELLNEFPCIADAVRYLGKKDKSGAHISDCCNGK